jgi:hypothetical protein
VWKADRARIRALLIEQGFTRWKNDFPNETGRMVKSGQEFEFYLLRKNSKGEIVVGGRWADWPFPHGSFGTRWGELEGVKCPVMSLEAQLSSKVEWPKQPYGTPLREKDLRDITLLRKLSGSRESHTAKRKPESFEN